MRATVFAENYGLIKLKTIKELVKKLVFKRTN